MDRLSFGRASCRWLRISSDARLIGLGLLGSAGVKFLRAFGDVGDGDLGGGITVGSTTTVVGIPILGPGTHCRSYEAADNGEYALDAIGGNVEVLNGGRNVLRTD